MVFFAYPHQISVAQECVWSVVVWVGGREVLDAVRGVVVGVAGMVVVVVRVSE